MKSLHLAGWFFVGLLSTTLLGCEKEKLGTLCGTDPTEFNGEVVVNENPTVEVVRIQRDGACESFQCLHHQGLHGYCTRTCELDPLPSNVKSCALDSDCKEDGFFCVDGKCRDDDCPSGFRCTTVQDVGPLAGKRYCTFITGCNNNTDCEALGDITCQQHGCTDVCNIEGASCDFHQLVCQPADEVPCVCNGQPIGGKPSCTDAELICQNPGAPTPYPQGSVAQKSFCIPKNR